MRLASAFARFAEPWPFVITALLAAMIGTSMGFYRIAKRFPDPVVTSDSFQAGIAYANAARAAARARAAGWSLEVETRLAGGGVQVDASLRDSTGTALAADAVTIERTRPAESGHDATFEMQAGARREIPLPLAGRWELRVVARRGDQQLEERIAVWMP
jgi:nitrogen fixation protein FixH